MKTNDKAQVDDLTRCGPTEATRAAERARKLVERFEYESMALHHIQREWLEREIAAEIQRPQDR